VVLAWALQQPGLDVYALFGPVNTKELADSLGAMNVQLTPDELAWLNLEKVLVAR